MTAQPQNTTTLIAPTLQGDPLLHFPLTDYGNAERLVLLHGRDILHCHGLGWFVWSGQRWLLDRTGETMRRTKDAARQFAAVVAAHPCPFAYFMHAEESEGKGRLDAALQLAASELQIAIVPEDLDKDPLKFNCKNYTMDLETGQALTHDRAHRITKLAPVTYDPAATCPRWDAFLQEIMGGNPALIDYLRRLAGYCLTADVSEHVFFLFYGTGANGKSVFIRILLALVGEYGRTIAPHLLLVTKNEQHPTGMADLFGCRVAVANEIEQEAAFAEAQVKSLTGGDRITARRMRQDFFEFSPTHKLIIASNYIPKVKGTDHGFWRRLHVIPFTVTIPHAKRDKHLADYLIEHELSGILNWALQGCADWRSQGLNPPQEILDAVAECQGNADPLKQFIADCCILSGQESQQALYNTYMTWCASNRETALNPRSFGICLGHRGLHRKQIHGYPTYVGISLKPSGPGSQGAQGAQGAQGGLGGQGGQAPL